MKHIKTYQVFENKNYDIKDPKDYVNLDFVEYIKELSLEYLDKGCELEITANISVETFTDMGTILQRSLGSSYMSNWPIYRCIFSQHRPDRNKEKYTEFDINHLGSIYRDTIIRDKYINGLFKAFDNIIYEVVLKTYRKVDREDVEEFYARIQELVKLEFPDLKARFVLGL